MQFYHALGAIMTDKTFIRDLDVKNKKVLMRVDFNVPLDDQGRITDATRIQAALPSIQHLLNNDAAVILMSHMGRPKGKVDPSLSLKPCAEKLSEFLEIPVNIAPDCVGSGAKKFVSELKPGEVLLLENLRFHKAEENPDLDPNFAKELASFADIYINEAFGTAHRKHASNVAITQFFPEKAASGFLMEKEIAFLGQSILHPEHPFFALIGGAKISSKIGVMLALIDKVDGILVGGGMAFTFLKAKGISIGNSIVEEDYIETAKEIIAKCEKNKVKLILPLDLVVADKFDNNANSQVIETSQGVPEGHMGLDIGPQTLKEFESVLQNARIILWNGPMGVFEMVKFARGTFKMAEILASVDGTTVVGGGDSIAAINASGLSHRFSHLSTGGGACLEYIEHGKLPAIEALSCSKSVRS
ncbi:Phosphoglycerate kinase [Chlamydiales bacterium SCGC AG-110-M15]|nr:Phosphoglycerate kinase [Chlamydiales bacterium SCGC AG-110-M15]